MARVPKDEAGNRIAPHPINPLPPACIVRGQQVAMLRQTRSYELITPMFGGGAQPGIADSDMVIRPSGIRGQLRFWWRATTGGAYDGDLKKMKEAEDLLFGAASTPDKPMPSLVDVMVKVTNTGEPIQPFSLERREGRLPAVKAREDVAPAYASFPLQPEQDDIKRYRLNTPINSLRAKVSFDLIITFPENQKKAVEAALWAWETFGGVGGRTRRGFGAVMLTAIDGQRVSAPKAQEAESFVRKGLSTYVSGGKWPHDVPHISDKPKIEFTGIKNSPTKAWMDLIRSLKEFRQDRYGGTERNRPGRSKWPEPDEIRRLTKCRSPKHAQELSHIRKFPRGAFGLPIIFHFKDEREGDPPTTTLQGAADDFERFASPLILRPLACEGGQGVGIALVLDGTSVFQIPDGLVLKEDRKQHAVEAALTPEEAAQIVPLRQNPDVLEAFLDSLGKNPITRR